MSTRLKTEFNGVSALFLLQVSMGFQHVFNMFFLVDKLHNK